MHAPVQRRRIVLKIDSVRLRTLPFLSEFDKKSVRCGGLL
jgi:hypothetical protein